MQKTTQILWPSCLFLAASVYILMPLRSVGAHFPPSILKYQPLALFSLILGAGLFFALGQVLKRRPSLNIPTRPPTTKLNGLALFGMIALAIVAFTQTALKVDGPLNYDENQDAKNLSKPALSDGMLFFDHATHLFAEASVYASMKVFGVNKFGLRAPALFISLLLLAMLIYYAAKTKSSLAIWLILGHLCVNEGMQWYMRSSRGYIGMIFFVAMAFLILIAYTQRKLEHRTLFLWLLGCGIVGAGLSHLFGTLYCGILTVTFVLWLYLNPSPTKEHHKYGVKLATVALATTTAIGIVSICQTMVWFKTELNFFSDEPLSSTLNTLATSIGIGRMWLARILIVLLAGLTLISVKLIKRENSFSILYLSLTVVILTFLVTALEVNLLLNRFFLPLVIPFVFLIADLIETLKPNAKTLATITSFALLVIAPLPFRQGIYISLQQNMGPFYSFIYEVYAITGPIKKHCYTFSPHTQARKFKSLPQAYASFSQNFYFHGAAKTPKCQKKFHLSFDGLPPETLSKTNLLKSKNNMNLYELN